MPTYDYHCESCKIHQEFSQKITDAPLKICPNCQKPTLKRGPGGGIGLAFKGSGFYINDYAKDSASTKACCPCGKNKCDK